MDGEGKPIAKAEVSALNVSNVMMGVGRIGLPSVSPVVTDHDGRFKLQVYAHPKWRFGVGSGLRILKGGTVSVAEGKRRLDVVIEAGPPPSESHLSGIVVDEAGLPVAGAVIAPLTTTTDALGRFEIQRRQFAIPGIVDLSVQKPGFEAARLDMEWGRDDLRVTLERGAKLWLTVTDGRNGKALQDYGLRFFRDGLLKSSLRGPVSLSRWQTTQFAGHHELGRCEVGPFVRGWAFMKVVPADPVFDPHLVHFRVDDAIDRGLKIVMQPASSRLVRVVEPSGERLAGAEIELLRALRDWPVIEATKVLAEDQLTGLAVLSASPTTEFARSFIARMTEALRLGLMTSGSRGECRVEAAPFGNLALRVRLRDYLPVTIDRIDLQAKGPVIVVLQKAAQLIAQLRPIGFEAKIQAGDQFGFYLRSMTDPRQLYPQLFYGFPGLVRPNPSGLLRIDGIPSGSWQLVFEQRASGFMSNELTSNAMGEPLTLAAGEVRRVSLRLDDHLPSELRGQAFFDGAIAGGAWFFLGGILITTDAQGRFDRRIPPGEYSVRMQREEEDYFLNRPISMRAEKTLVRDFHFESRRIRLRLLGADGKGLGEQKFVVSSAVPLWSKILVTDAEGVAELIGGPFGLVDIRSADAKLSGQSTPAKIMLDAEAARKGIELQLYR